MPYSVAFVPSAADSLRKLPAKTRGRVAAKIDALQVEPRPPGVEKLSGQDELYRIRSGRYRVIYRITDEVLEVLIVRIGHRRDVYRDL